MAKAAISACMPPDVRSNSGDQPDRRVIGCRHCRFRQALPHPEYCPRHDDEEMCRAPLIEIDRNKCSVFYYRIYPLRIRIPIILLHIIYEYCSHISARTRTPGANRPGWTDYPEYLPGCRQANGERRAPTGGPVRQDTQLSRGMHVAFYSRRVPAFTHRLRPLWAAIRGLHSRRDGRRRAEPARRTSIAKN